MAINNLFPPIFGETYMPAFLIDSGNIEKDTCKLYFSISKYNSFSEIANVQITVVSQNTNISVLNEEKYPCGIMLATLKEDITRESDDKYYVEIKKTDMENENFEIGQFYKVQARFTSTDAAAVSLDLPQSIDSWLAGNLSNFSEWSRACIIHGISSPKLFLSGFDISAESTIWNSTNIDIIGKLTFSNPLEKETLKSYQIKLYDEFDKLLSDSGLLYSNDYVDVNQFNYTFEYALQDGEEYKLEVAYTTKNLYTETIIREFTIVEAIMDPLNADIFAIPDCDNGRNEIQIVWKNNENFIGNITIRRTSSESNYTLWEDVHTASLNQENLNYVWFDYTIKSGVWYKYCVQKRTSTGERGTILQIKKPIINMFEDIFLNADGLQLKIQFDPDISSFKNTIAEAKIDTIGSKYPIIKRNGYMNYKEFPISGLISHLVDEDKLFTSREEIFDESLELYDNYNWENRITSHNDYIYEREFREKVKEFLYKNNVKLFRSLTEGNILVKLMNISFTPKKELGRYIYSFSCMAYEVADFTLSNCNFYNIQLLGDYGRQKYFSNDYIGQEMRTFNPDEDIMKAINEKYQKYAKEGFIAKVDYLDYLKIEMNSKPYLIGEGAAGPYPLDSTEASEEELNAAFLGYIVIINDKAIVLDPKGIYELKQEDVKIISLSFPTETDATIDYHMQLHQEEDLNQVSKITNYYKRVGQCWGRFGYQDSIYKKIWNKYYQKYKEYMQTMVALDDVRIEAEPGTVVYIKESKDNTFEKHIIGPTGTLNLQSEDSVIDGIYFSGMHLEQATEEERQRNEIPSNKYIDTGIILDTLDGVVNPIRNGVYTFSNPFLKTYMQDVGEYKLMTQNNPIKHLRDLAIIREAKIIKNKNGDYTMLINSSMDIVDEDGGITVPEESFEFFGDIRKGKYEIEVQSITEPDKITIDEENNPLYPDRKKDGYKLSVKTNDKDVVPPIDENKVIDDKTLLVKENFKDIERYKMTVNEIYDKIFALILQQEIDSTNKFIWYNNEWWAFTDGEDLICPVEGLIDYTYELMKGMYII